MKVKMKKILRKYEKNMYKLFGKSLAFFVNKYYNIIGRNWF